MVIKASIGEVVDKATILCIKANKIADAKKLENIIHELDHLLTELSKISITENDDCFKNLVAVNKELWDVEDKLRLKEKKQEFDVEFIELARSVYMLNDRRFMLKREITQKHSTEDDFQEEKSYL